VPPTASTAWLEAHLEPFDTAGVRPDRTDLVFLDNLMSDARIIGLGEATHGTSEFFQVKHRILDYLVKEQGVRLFALEANIPEMNRIDDWVRGGPGDPDVLLSLQGYWMWNAQEVLDLLLWARDFNQGRATEDQVSVQGIDMQLPGMAIHDVVAYLGTVDPAAALQADEDYECYWTFANKDPGLPGVLHHWKTLSDPFLNACRQSMANILQSFDDHRSQWIAASSVKAFERARHNARVIQQSEEYESGIVSRDTQMAENVEWILDQNGPQSRVVIWAHNLHIHAHPNLLGGKLKERFEDDYLAVGLTFGGGDFNALEIVDGESGPVTVFQAPLPPQDSYEYYFVGPDLERYVLDLRQVDTTEPGAGFLGEPLRFRFYPAGHTGEPTWGYFPTSLLEVFDALVFFRITVPSTLLPFRLPDSFDYPYGL
jgi:erythromycin esterase